MQKLILPINKCRVTASYKNANYKKEFGYTHFGVDMTDEARKDDVVWASGVGEVVATGWSESGGNVIVVRYKQCQLKDGSVKDLIIRYYHMHTIIRKVGDKVTKDSRLGRYGNTGASAGAHLHLEIDTDVNYPCHTPQISKDSGVLKKGIDTTINPLIALYVKKTKPDHQKVVKANYNTVTTQDINYQTY